MWLVVLDYPVRLQITRELEKIPVLVQLAFRGIPLFSLLLDLFRADGMAGGLNQAGIYGYPLVDGQPFLRELLKNNAVDPGHRLFGQTAPKSGKCGMVGG